MQAENDNVCPDCSCTLETKRTEEKKEENDVQSKDCCITVDFIVVKLDDVVEKFWKAVKVIQPWLSVLAVVCVITSLYESVFEVAYEVDVYNFSAKSPLELARVELDVSYIPCAMGLFIKMLQAVSILIYFTYLQLGTVQRLENYTMILLGYPLLCTMIVLGLYPQFYLRTVRFTIEIMVIGFYQMWLMLTIEHNYVGHLN